MTDRSERNQNDGDPTPAAAGENATTAKSELSIEFDDIVAVAIFETILKHKPRKSWSRGTGRHPR